MPQTCPLHAPSGWGSAVLGHGPCAHLGDDGPVLLRLRISVLSQEMVVTCACVLATDGHWG